MRKGFTLVELLAVIVILAVLLAIAIPSISGIINNTTKSSFENDAKMVLQQFEYEKINNHNFDVRTATEEALANFNLSKDNYNSLRVGIINNEPYTIILGKNKWNGLKACGTLSNMKVVSSNDNTSCESMPVYTNPPVLAAGMTAIKWSGSAWVNTNFNDPDWYNYVNQEWANAKTADGSYWVWIPRYAYKITSRYHSSTTGTIDVKFLIKDTNMTNDSTPIVVSNDSQNNYVVHPAFTFGGTQLTGIWVAKFEMSGTTASLDSKPGVPALQNASIGNMFTASRNMETNSRYGWGLASGLKVDGTFTTDANNVDTHLMKNEEWGAVTYLSQSQYGKYGNSIYTGANKEIYQNKSSSLITGSSNGTPSQSTTNTQCTYNDITDRGSGTGSCGGGASTTGNIYGIYDMSGGSWEYVMGNLNNLAANSGLTPSSIHDKYIDRYTAYDNTKFGDAVYETSSSSSNPTSWYGDLSIMPYSSFTWFYRGGGYNVATPAGVFYFSATQGEVGINNGFRVIILVGTGL